ncbi:MAG: hypothetical protein OQL19_21870 [Gammaproteobacteria bacterium]|nr:hypothetical protein [Gammaproteobacteria bacterium]
MTNKKKPLYYLLIIIGLLPFLIMATLFIPSIQKKIVESHLSPWISNASVDSIHITPFSIKIEQLKFKYEAIDIDISHMDSEISPFDLLSQRIKINKLVLDKIQINDSSLPSEKKDDSIILFHGLFPYFNTGFIYDIGLLNIQADYNSAATGPVQINLSGKNINENTGNPIKLNVTANELNVIPDVQGLFLNSSIILRQHTERPIYAHQSQFNLALTGNDGTKQFIETQLSMKQLPKPDKWASFPFDKRQTHYLRERLHPESINLQITHTNQNNKTLSDIYYNGQYDGNEGIISGSIKLLTDKQFTSLFKSLDLPKIESQITAQFHYNTRSLEGSIDLKDKFKLEDYIPGHISSKTSSLPETIDISNHLTARIDDKTLEINRFLLNMLSGGQDYIKILTHKALLINLNRLPEFLEQQNTDLMTVSINQLPLTWFDDFIPEYQLKEGLIDTDINLAIDNKTLKLISKRPISLKNLTLLEKPEELADNNESSVPESDPQSVSQEQKAVPLIQAAQALISRQNIEADVKVHINNEKLDASIKQLKLYQHNQSDQVIEQISSSLDFNMDNPLHFLDVKNDTALPPVTLKTNGTIDIQALTKIPVISRNLEKLTQTPSDKSSTNTKEKPNKTLAETLPKALSLNYQFNIDGKSDIWSIKQSNITLLSGKKEKQSNSLFNLKNFQPIQFKKNKEQFKLISNGQLLSTQVNHFDFNWISPLIKKHASPYTLSGQLAQLDLAISSIAESKNQSSDLETPETDSTKKPQIKQDSFKITINKLNFNQLKSFEDEKLLFKDININSQLNAYYSPEQINITYPSFSIKKNKALLLHNSGKITIKNPGNEETQQLSLSGKLDGYLNQIINLNIVNHYIKDKAKLSQQSIVDSQYNLSIKKDKLTVNPSEFNITHPQNNGRLVITTKKPISLSLKDKQQDFSQNGHLTLELINFNLKPYEAMVPELPITFDHANGFFDLTQTAKKQKITLKKPFKFQNIHFKDKEKRLLEPFNIVLDFSADQNKNITQGEIKQLSITFLNEATDKTNKANAFNLNSQFKLDSNKDIILTQLDGSMDLLITQWLKQPAAMPNNTLSQGSLKTHFSLDKTGSISHDWLINNLVEKSGKQLVETISINGTGQLKSLSNFHLELPIVMKSVSGESNLLFKTKTLLQKDKNKIVMSIDGKQVFLNDLLKLLAAINPKSELAQLESTPEPQEDAQETEVIKNKNPLDKTPAAEPFWKSGIDISAQLKIDQLYYTDYMSYQDITGELDMTNEKLYAKNFEMKFHESPMKMNALLDFDKANDRPYDIKFNTTLNRFGVGKFLKELNPEHVPRADGVFDVDVKIYGGLSNLSQFRNELLFDILIEGKDGVYHLIPADDVMLRSSGAAMAVVGEVVSVLPTSGFGLGIVNRVIRFTKDIHYDFIKMHLIRQEDLHTSIKTFQILSPELHLFATGGLTFVEDTRLFDQPLEMTAQLDLAGEGAAIFYGLGLLEDEQDQYGFWKGPIINFSGTLNHQEDNFNEIISKAKEGTVVGGVTNPFSGIVGNFKYRFFGEKPKYDELYTPPESEDEPSKEVDTPSIKAVPVKQTSNEASFFDETF